MPQESQLAHRNLRTTNLPYITNVSPIDTEAKYISGSKDLLTSINGYAERRPGFADAVETTPTAFNSLQRLFTWDRTDGTFIVMASDVSAGNRSVVYKMVLGADASFVSIWADPNSNTPYDFVVSNNTVYFSNGSFAKKWDPSNGISNWGIAIGAIAGVVGPNAPGSGTNVANLGSGGAWANPGNITVQDGNFATFTTHNNYSDYLEGTNFGFAIPSGNSIQGIQIDIKGMQTSSDTAELNVVLLRAGVPAGTTVSTFLPTSNSFITIGGPNSLFGTTWSPSDIDNTNFGVAMVAFAVPPNIPYTFSIDFVRITIYSLGGPPISVSGAAGTMTATAGYQYVYCYGNSITGHISSPTPVSANTGVFTNKANVSVTLTASTDPQVNQIRVFRTTDGGGGTYYELPTSPYPNTSGAITDSAPDTFLNVLSIAPNPTFNDPPPPFQNMVYFSGRIWGFIGNKVWFSGLEEINQGVPEESFPSGIAGNFWAFDQPTKALAIAGGVDNQILTVFCGGRLYGITGNTLDTFRRFNISQRRGCRNFTAVSMLGGMVGWLDSSNQIWATDGNNMQELTKDIRPDLAGINPALCSMTFHISGRYHWAVFSINGSNGYGPTNNAFSADRNISGTVAWGNIGNIFVADNLYATAAGVTSTSTHYLQCGAIVNVPTPAVITGIAVTVKGFQTNVTANQTFTAQLTKGLTTLVGAVRTSQLPASNGIITFGGPSDLWGTTWSPGDVGGGSGFSVYLQGVEAGGVSTDFNVDFVGITIYTNQAPLTYVYDMDLGQWMPPWSFGSQYIYSGETSPGNYVLMAAMQTSATTTKAVQLNPNKFNDNGATYAPVGRTGLLSVIPDYGKRFSYGAMGIYDEPSRTGVPWTFQITNNAQTITNFKFVADDDPAKATYTSIVANLQDTATTYNRTNGTFLKQNVYPVTAPAARWVGIEFDLANADQVDNIYEVFMAYKGLGGR